MPKCAIKIVCILRKRQCINPRLYLSSVGKRTEGRTAANQDSAPDRRYFVRIKLEKFSARALVDPGAISSFVSNRTAYKCIRSCWQCERVIKAAAMADGSEASLDSSIIGRLEVCSRNSSIIGRLEVCSVLRTLGHDALLGMDILLRLNLDVTLAGRTLPLGKNDYNTDICAVESPPGLALIQTKKNNVYKSLSSKKWTNSRKSPE